MKKLLIELADKYECREFLVNDPSQFMHRYKKKEEQEVVAFIAANLAFGKREQILLHVEKILSDVQNNAEGHKNIIEWILTGQYKAFFYERLNVNRLEKTSLQCKSFYRLYTFRSMELFFDTLKSILEQSSLGEFFRAKYKSSGEKYLHLVIASCFPKECNLISHSKDSAAKKLNMFLRWMVRDNSPVDLGLWTSWYSKKNLLMPLDVHVMQEATNFGLLEKNSNGNFRSASLKTAVELTQKMKEFFPDDPVRGDFALFGLGVNK